MAKNQERRTFEIDTGVNPDFLETTLTQDITTLEAIFDLVDNSIDAARDVLLNGKVEIGRDGLPVNYANFKIHIRIDRDSIRVLDNCSGISEETLSKQALYTARPSKQEYGIGQYGVGLKRSLLKMGTNFALAVDNGDAIFKSRFCNKSIGGNLENKVYATEYPSKSRTKSLFCSSELKPEISNDLHDSRWFDNAKLEFSFRYGIFLLKGLEIVLHNVATKQFVKVEGIAPSLRIDSRFSPVRKRVSIDGVEIVIESGIHRDYTFPSEKPKYNISQNKKLTNYFGMYFSCNDRVVIAASTEKSYGWNTKWHSEYNGYVCWIKFVSKDPSKLPWNTSKTALRTDSSLFLEVKDKLQPIADHYRSEIKKRYAANTDHQKVKKKIPIVSRQKESRGSKLRGKLKPQSRPKVELPRDRDILIDWNNCETIVPENRSKEYHIFDELCRLSSKDSPITCVVMLRVFLEATAKQASSVCDLQWQNLAKSSLRVAEKLHGSDYIESSVLELVKQYSNTEEGLFSIKNIQSHIHSPRFHPNQSNANTYWDELDPFLAGCWRFIQDYDKQ